MSRLGIPEGKFNQNDWNRFLKATRQAVETFDFDSGWIATPGNKVVQHKLGVLPKKVLVYASANSNGNPFQPDTFTQVDTDAVTITGPAAFCRVLVDV